MPNHQFNGARFAGRPLLMHAPRMADLFGTAATPEEPGLLARLTARLPGVGHEKQDKPQALYSPACAESSIEGQGRYVIADEIAVMDIKGPLLDRDYYYYGASYDHITTTLNAIADDDRAKAVFIRLDSPGGLVAGLHEAAAALDSLRATGKTIHVYTPSICASAAMWLAAAADRIIASPTAVLGSIGVVWVHWNESAWLEKAGIEVTPIQFGDKKTDAAWWKELSDQARTDAQNEINTIGEMFVSAISQGRGLDAQVIRDQQAGVFMGDAAIAAGLADTVMLEGAAFAALRDEISTSSGGAIPAATPAVAAPPAKTAKGQSRPAPAADPCPNSTQKRSNAMSLKSTLAKILGGKAKNLSAGQLSAIRAAAEKDNKDPEAEDGTEDEDVTAADGTEDDGEDTADPADPADPDTDGDAEEDDDEDGDGADNVEAKVLRRVTAITGCKEAKGREKLAAKLAAQPGMKLKTAQSILRCAPKASSLAAAMAGQDPTIANDGGNPAAQSSTIARAQARWGKKKGA